MARRPLATFFCLCSFSLLANEPVRTCRELLQAVHDRSVGQTFDVTALVNSVNQTTKCFSLQDSSGSASIRSLEDDLIARWPNISRWDFIHVTGHVFCEEGDVKARAKALRIVGKRPAVKPVPASVPELLHDKTAEGRYVTLVGTVDDVFHDEIDPRWIFLILNADGERIFVDYKTDTPAPETLIGADIRLSGVFDQMCFSSRKFFGSHLVTEYPEDVTVLRRRPGHPFSAPPLDACTDLRPQDIAALDRRRVSGRVLVGWNGTQMLLGTPDARSVRVNLTKGPLPSCGTFVEAVGFPETDLFRVNLTRAVWRTAPAEPPVHDNTSTNVPLSDLLNSRSGFICPDFHGRVVRIRGYIRNLKTDVGGRGTFSLHADGESLVVDASEATGALLALGDGWHVSVTGICVVEAEEWRPNLVLPHITGLRLVLRSSADIVSLARPPWWTPARLFLVIVLLVVILVAIAVWNRSLRRLAERRGRQLAHEAIGRAESELKVCERTRLAVELHDALSQTLTGVAMEIRAADKTLGTDHNRSHEHLVRAERTVDACRGELKNCLWDLRNDAIDEADMNEAIRRTLAPHLGAATLTVRFAVPRDRFSDNTAHAILRILRELTVNAIRHGHATTLRIAGAIEGDKFLFSVRDNGCGFDPESAPGIDEGHFGIQGIRERIERFGGDLEISSKTGHGTRISVALNVPKEEST